MSTLRERISMGLTTRALLLVGLLGLLGLCLFQFLWHQNWVFALIPFVGLVMAWGIRDFRTLYLMIWLTIPFAVEIDLPGGLATDFPAEPIMWACCFFLPVYLYLNHHEISFRFIFNPLFVLLFFHFAWIIFTSVTSQDPMISFKYTLAKSWYLICFILIPLLLFKNAEDYKQWGLFLFFPLILSVLIILYRHSQLGFTFSTINNAVIPIYRNHVDYACSLGILLPFAWWMRRQFTGFNMRLFFAFAMAVMVAGIYFSYTRAAWLCIPLAIGCYFVIRMRLIRILIPFALAGVILFVGWLAYDNRYIGYSPDYQKTITHQNFDDLVSASYKMEDISTVERFYRWIAGYYMVKERPVLGFGPASFYNEYHSYVDRHFTTYVSDNPEHSGIHNYYLMTAVEQGFPGLFILLALMIAVLIIGENLYHRMKESPERDLLMVALISFACSLFILTLNDTVETDKLGTFFFLCIAIVIQFHLREQKAQYDQAAQ